MAEFAKKFGYYEPSIGVSGRLHCNECVHTLNNGIRHYGIIKSLSPYDPNYGKLCLYCKLQDAYVKPFAWCDVVEKDTNLGGGNVEGT